MPTSIDRSRDQGIGSLNSEYAQYNASTDPVTSGLARMGAAKMGGGGEQLIRDLILALQSFSGLENGGVTAGASIQANLQRMGAPAMGAAGGGMIGGRDVITFQAAQAMQAQMMQRFTNPITGAPNAAAQGLSASELGRLGGQIISQGGTYSGGPMFQAEVLSQNNIAQYRKDGLQRQQQGREHRDKTGDSSQLRAADQFMQEVNGMKEGQFRVTLTSNADKITQMMEDGAKTLSSLKEIFGSDAIKKLEESSQLLFGGSMQEFGQRAARLRTAHVKTMSQAYFDGDVKGAASFSIASANSVAGYLGGPGMSAQEAQERFGMIGANAAQAIDVASISGGRNRQAQLGMGVRGRARSMTELQQQNSSDVAAYINEEQEALALVSTLQTYDGSLSADQKAQAESALTDLEKATTGDGKNNARAQINALVERLTGKTSGGVLGDGGGAQKVLENLSGAFAGRTSRMSTNMLRNLNQDSVAANLRADSEAAGLLGVSGDELALLGTGLGNLSSDQQARFLQISEQADPAKRQEAMNKLLGEGDVQASLAAGGVDAAAFAALMAGKGGGLGRGKFTDILGKLDDYEDTGNFTSAGERLAVEKNLLRNFMTSNQSGKSASSGDLATEFMRGLLGEKGISSGDILERARNTGGAGLSEFAMKDGMLAPEAAEGLMGVKGLADELGVKTADQMRDLLKSPSEQLRIAESLRTRGTISIDNDKFTYLDEDATRSNTQAAENEGRTRMLEMLGKKGTSFARKDGETEAEAKTRYDKEVRDAITTSAQKPGYDGTNNQWSSNDSMVQAYGAGDTGVLDYAMANGGISSVGRRGLLKSSQGQLDAVNARLVEATSSGASEEIVKPLQERQANLMDLLEKLGGGSQTMNAQTVNITTQSLSTPGGDKDRYAI